MVRRSPTVADYCWLAGTVAAIVPATWWVIAGLRAGRFGVDILAVLSLAGSVAVGEYLAGALIAVMLATGQALDAAAERRATKDLRALLDRCLSAPCGRTPDGVEMADLDAIVVGDVVVVGPGEVLPVDGTVVSEYAVIDDSALTGEPLQVRYACGEAVRSGSLNAGAGLEIRASATAADSTYAASCAWPNRPPPSRRRWCGSPIGWPPGSSRGAGHRRAGMAAERIGNPAVAVLVVATPCPLLLAAPVAIVSGLSRASRIGVLVRGGGPLETLGRASIGARQDRNADVRPSPRHRYRDRSGLDG